MSLPTGRILQMFNSSRLLITSLIVTMTISAPVKAVEIIVNSQTAPSQLTQQQLKAIYMGQQALWPNGVSIKLFVLKSTTELHHSFIVNSLGLYPYQFNRRWQKLVFSGFATQPTEARNTQEMLQFIATTPGGIGYVKEKVTLRGVSYVTIN